MEDKISEFSKKPQSKVNNQSFPPQTPANRELKIKIVIGMLSVAILLLGLGLMYVAYLFNNSQKVMVDDKSGANVVVDESPESEGIMDDPTKDWKTYTSEEYGFSIKYPQDFVVGQNNEFLINFTKWGPTQKPQAELYDGISIHITYSELNGVELKKYVEDIIKLSETNGLANILTPLSKVQLGGVSGYSYVSQGLGTFEHIYLPLGSKGFLFILNLTADPQELGYKKIVDEMKSTLKFKDSVLISTSDTPQPLLPSQTRHVSKKLGVEFLYIKDFASTTEKILVKEIGNKIYIYGSALGPEYGQYVEVFDKDISKSPEKTLQDDFLASQEFNQNCRVTNNSLSFGNNIKYPETYTKANIEVVEEFENVDQMFLALEGCPAPYTQSNGISYFLFDSKHPSKYFFISIGQYVIGAGENLAWYDTIRFID